MVIVRVGQRSLNLHWRSFSGPDLLDINLELRPKLDLVERLKSVSGGNNLSISSDQRTRLPKAPRSLSVRNALGAILYLHAQGKFGNDSLHPISFRGLAVVEVPTRNSRSSTTGPHQEGIVGLLWRSRRSPLVSSLTPFCLARAMATELECPAVSAVKMTNTPPDKLRVRCSPRRRPQIHRKGLESRSFGLRVGCRLRIGKANAMTALCVGRAIAHGSISDFVHIHNLPLLTSRLAP